jgi:hypothetical protein
VVSSLPPVGSATSDAPPEEEDTDNQAQTTILAGTGGGSAVAERHEVLGQTSLSLSQPILRPDLQRSSLASTEYDYSIDADIWLDFLSLLNSSPNTTQVLGEEISVMVDYSDLGEMPDEQFFSIDSGLQLSGLALSAGFVSWAIRGAGLFASLLTSLPAWRHMDPLPILKEEEKEKEKEKDWTLREDDDGNDTDGEDFVENLWTPGGGVTPAWSDTGATILISSGRDAQMAEADVTMSFLENVVPRADSSEPEKPA